VSLVPTEIELKLALPPAAKDLLLRHPAVKALRRGRTRKAQVTSAYFDSAGFTLAKKGVALRVRRVGSRWVQTIKGPSDSSGAPGLRERSEHEWPLTRPALDFARLATTPWRKVIAKAAKHGPLVRAFTTDFERQTIPLRFADGTLALLCLDRGEIRAVRDGHTHRASISEAEIELESGDAANLFVLARTLAAELPLAVMTADKAERGFALRRGERNVVKGPVRARSVELADEVTTLAAFSALIGECLHQIASNAGLVADSDPEWVHQMRIGTRRLRSCLSLLERYAPSAELNDVLTETKWLASALGAARDWDVFVRETLPPLAAWFKRDPATAAGLKRLRGRAEARRRVARAAARSAVASQRFQRLLLSAGLLCALPRLGAPLVAADAGPDALAATAGDFAMSLLTRRQRKLDMRASLLVDGTPEERHAVRIAAKRLRYIAEFFAPLFSRKRSKAYLKALAALQDVLGRLNDASTALRVANETGGPSSDAATGAVRGWVAAQAAALEPEVASAWRRFAAAKPFWLKD
jgi:inorganic triphosphatase YgiF